MNFRQKRHRRLQRARLKHKPWAKKSIVTHKLKSGRTGSMQQKLRRCQPRGLWVYIQRSYAPVLSGSVRAGAYDVARA